MDKAIWPARFSAPPHSPIDVPHQGRDLRPALTSCGLLGVLMVLSMATPLAAQERFLPAASAVVLPASVHAQGGRQSQLRALDQARKAQPQNLDAALAYGRAVFTLGLNEGDLRWYGSAKAALGPWWQATDLPADGFFLRGLVKQGFHDFQGGLADINRAIALEPRRAEFWSWRFALNLLQADMAMARQDTEEIARLFGAEESDVYRAILLYRTGHPLPAVQMLTRAIALEAFAPNSDGLRRLPAHAVRFAQVKAQPILR
jgi:tetratricopeptide (TPR) repeat protein